MSQLSKRIFGSSTRLIGNRIFKPMRDSQAHYIFSVTLDTQRTTSSEVVLVFDKETYTLIGVASTKERTCEIRTYDAKPTHEFLVVALDQRGELEAEAVDNCAPEVVWL
ncbi:hypothetical protein [Pseudoalteromonas byunsanensis]|uniref:Uncharacterized protein n=1 Tax=Pseudoalteromonas byunsanensis TaxID=327939 RepID=A0A1S1NAN7_9GAMM|nr:hypothetical protein [Pseudoalteromonas byunsanensis]OHU97139.1 hypothetical protein BIW53_02125 [Pseudoalteromonas byunsanensis]